MKPNYLLPSINAYFEEITSYEGDILTIHSLLKFYKSQISFEKRQIKWLSQLVSTYRDLSLIHSEHNLFFTNYNYSLNENNFIESLDWLESRESLNIIAKVYEVFESYLKDILVQYFSNNNNIIETIEPFNKIYLGSSSIRSAINKFKNNERNNKKLIWILRRISPFYEAHETENIYHMPMHIWFDLVSDIRHIIIHNRQKVTKSFLSSLNDHPKREIFDRFLSVREFNQIEYLYAEQAVIGNLIHFFNQFAHLVFKSISIDAKLNPEYKKLHPTSRQPQQN